MSQLTDISVQFRKIAIWIGIGIVALIVLQFLFRLLVAALTRPTGPAVVIIVPTPTPDIRFGRLPYPKFSVIQQTSAGLSLQLINIEGKPPEASGTGKIFTMPKKLPSLLTNDRAMKFASRLGYTDPPQVLDSRKWVFPFPAQPLLTLSMDRVVLNFQMKFDWHQNPTSVFGPDGVDRTTAINSINNFIGNNGLFDDTLFRGKTTVTAIRYDSQVNDLVPVSKFTRANAVRMDFFRNNIENLPVVPPGFNASSTYAIYSPLVASTYTIAMLRFGLVDLSYSYWPVALDDYATYPLRTSDAAWKDLQDGFGTVVHRGTNTEGKIIVREIYLAYLDTSEPQTYLQPIFVFTGDNGFVAYLPAIQKDYLQ